MLIMTDIEFHTLFEVAREVNINSVRELLELMREWNITDPRELVEIYKSGR